MKNNGIILSHSGKQHSYHVAKALKELELLSRFFTSSYIKNGWLQERLISSGNRYWTRRFIPGLNGNLVKTNWWLEVPEVFLRAIEGRSARAQEAIYTRDIKFDYQVANRLKNEKNANIFWGFQGSCHESLKAARALGLEAWCELSTAHVTLATNLLGEEAQLEPRWAPTIDNLVFPLYYQKRLQEEPHLATKVIAASAFTKSSLVNAGIREEKIKILPLGCDVSRVPYTLENTWSIEKRALKVLYAGTITQRKGISYLLEAARLLSPEIKGREIEIHLVGGIQGKAELLKPYLDLIKIHPPVSQQELFKLYGEFDALVLPTIFEGFGLVIIEAMAAGLPVITTRHSIGPELIIPGVNGYIIPIRDPGAIKDAIWRLREKSAGEYVEIRQKARESALQYSWDGYASRLKNFIDTFALASNH